jgi:hypothetical protein
VRGEVSAEPCSAEKLIVHGSAGVSSLTQVNSRAKMFTIQLREGLYSSGATLCAKAQRLDHAISFVQTFSMYRMIIAGDWFEDGGRFVLDVFDWTECWFADPQPLGRITAPTGFRPDGIRQ